MRTRTQNPNCDGDKCRKESGEVRLLPLDKDTVHGGNLILCHACYTYEIAYRKERNSELSKGCQFDLPAWESLKVYGGQ